jgi:hypothetical protein
MDETERKVQRNEWRLDALDQWRKDQVDPRLAILDKLLSDSELDSRLQRALLERKQLHLTLYQKVGVGLFAVLSPVVTALLLKLLHAS